MLRYHYINFETGEIEVAPKRSTEKTLPWESKDHERRLAPLTQQTRLIFEEIRQVSDPENPYVFISAKRYKHLMIHKDQWRDDKALVNNLRRNFRSLCDKADVPKDAFHSLRKACCTNLLEGGVAPHAVQKIMGHSSLETTIRYYSKVRRDQISVAREVSQKYEAGLPRSISHRTKTA
ncbi:MAG: tyrosine-type recombinase/integrase [Phycisphaerae bacterium]